MLTLRFQRVGKKHDTTFRVVAVDSHFSSKSGKVKEILGWWNPRPDKFELKKERIEYWLKNGAQVSDSCYNLLIKAKIIEGKKRPITIRKKKAKEGEVEAQIKAEAPKTEEKQPKEVPAEPTIEAPKVKEKMKEEPKEESKTEKTPSSAKATEGREKSEEKSKEKSKEQKEKIKEDAGSK